MPNKNTESKDKQKEKDKRARSITSKAEFKNVEIHNEILEQQVGVSTPGSVPSTLTRIQLRNGTIKAHYGERHGRPASNTN
jgi:hypothetical protein